MGIYLVTNTTNLAGNPTSICIGDIPNAPIIYIEPGEAIDLELLCTRNQILDSRHLREHVLHGRATIDVQGSPRDRIFVDANVSGITIEEVIISGPISSSNFPTTVDTNYGSVGNNTLRTAAQVGNSSGQADFNAGASSAQTLRTTSNLSDGYGNKISSTSGTLNINVSNTPTVNQGTSPWIVSGTVNTAAPTGNIDAFGRTRVSNPTTLGDYHHVSAEDPGMTTLTTGAGTGVSDNSTCSFLLTVGSGATDSVIHQSKMYHHYLPGKSQLINTSFLMGTSRINTIKRVGYFDDRNGIFLQQAGDGTLSFVMRSYVTGAPQDITITQANWNQDTCNSSITGIGTLPDGSHAINYGRVGTWDLDITKVQLLMIDFQWLGVGRLRVGFVHNGNWIVAHEFYHSNYSTNVYWSQPSLPVRCEIRNTGIAVGSTVLKQICSTVISEGGYSETGLVFSTNSSLTGRILQNGGSTLPVVAIRLKNSLNGDLVRGIVRPLLLSILCTDGPIYYELRRFNSHTAISGGSWVSIDPASIVEYNVSATSCIAGTTIASDFLSAASSKNTTASGELNSSSANKRGFITQNYDSSESECYALVATALGSSNNVNVAVYGSLQWSETR